MTDREKLIRIANDWYDEAFKASRKKTIDEVLAIIDSEAWSYCDYIIKHENGNSDKQVATSLLSENIREAVLALKGGEHEDSN